MGLTPLDKGNQLEDAVRAIETAIVRDFPAYEESTFTLRPKKVVKVDGVTHEIDLFVDIDLGKGYKSIVIFETKNWDAQKVGKNEVIVLSEKIDAVQAQRGYLIAKDFTADAEAQAGKDARLELLVAAELSCDIPTPFAFHMIQREPGHLTVWVKERGEGEPDVVTPMNPAEVGAKFGGGDIDFDQYLKAWGIDESDDIIAGLRTTDLDAGRHEFEFDARRDYDPGELTIDGRDVAEVQLEGTFALLLWRPAIVSHFDVKTRGRALLLAPVEIPGHGIVKVSFAQKDLDRPDN